MPGIKWTKDEIEYLILNYQENSKLNILNSLKHRTWQAIQRKTSTLNIKRTQKEIYRKYIPVDDFFSSYTQESCYIAGFIAADGNIESGRNVISIKLKSVDRYVLEYILRLISPNTPIKNVLNKDACVFKITSIKMAIDLKNNFNITPAKSLTMQYPLQIPFNMHKYFIRGHFDGDGSYYTYKATYRNWECLRCVITAPYWFLESIRNIFNAQTNTNLTNKIAISKNSITAQLAFMGKKAIMFGDWIYEDSTFHMTRKHNQYLKFKNGDKTK